VNSNAGKKILVIDDERDVRVFLSTLLEQNGYEVLTAEDGLTGFELAQREKPDLVSLDLQMPDKSGTDFYRRLTRDPQLKKTPIIVVSALSGRYLAVKEAVAVFDKPIDPDEYLSAVAHALGA
jgi:CheY-like chemotaxis protein